MYAHSTVSISKIKDEHWKGVNTYLIFYTGYNNPTTPTLKIRVSCPGRHAKNGKKTPFVLSRKTVRETSDATEEDTAGERARCTIGMCTGSRGPPGGSPRRCTLDPGEVWDLAGGKMCECERANTSGCKQKYHTHLGVFTRIDASRVRNEDE